MVKKSSTFFFERSETNWIPVYRKFAFLNIKVSLRSGKVLLTCTLNLLTVVSNYTIYLLIHTTLNSQLSLARLCELVGYVVQRRILKIIKKK